MKSWREIKSRPKVALFRDKHVHVLVPAPKPQNLCPEEVPCELIPHSHTWIEEQQELEAEELERM